MWSKVSLVFEDFKFKTSNVSRKIEVLLYLPCLVVGLQPKQGRDWKTSILLVAFSNFKLKVLKYQWNFRPHTTVILKFGDTPKVGIWYEEIKKIIHIIFDWHKSLMYEFTHAYLVSWFEAQTHNHFLWIACRSQYIN